MRTYIICQRLENGKIKHLEHYFTFEDAKEALMLYQYGFYQTKRSEIADSLFIKEQKN